MPVLLVQEASATRHPSPGLLAQLLEMGLDYTQSNTSRYPLVKYSEVFILFNLRGLICSHEMVPLCLSPNENLLRALNMFQ